MNSKLTLTTTMIVFGLVGCIASASNAIKDVKLGMSTDEILGIVGEPTVQVERGPFQAWRYEYRVLGPGPCGQRISPAGGGGTPCRQVCEHTTVWFNGNEVRSMTSILVDDLEVCGTGSIPIFWEHMPDYVEEPST